MSELRKLAEAAKEWSNVTEIRSDTGDYGCTIGGMVDGEFYPVVTVECESYYADSMPLAAYIAAANPATVIGLMDEIDRLRTEAVAADIRIANDALVIAGLTAERDELRAALAERDAKLAALEVQEPVAGTIKIGDKILAAPSGSCSTTHFVTINVISNSRAVAPVVNQHTRLHYLKGSDAIATFCALSDLFSGACQETSRVNKPNLYDAAGAAMNGGNHERS